MSERKILGTIPAAEFIGRSSELERLNNCALDTKRSGIALLGTPGAGTSELLRQTYDRLFSERSDVIPIYFAVSPNDDGPRKAALRFASDFLTQTVAFRRQDPAIIDASPEMHELAELAIPADGYWVDRLVESFYTETESPNESSFVKTLLSAPIRASANGVRFFVMIDDLHNTLLMPDGADLLTEIRQIYERSDSGYVFAGARRFLFGLMPIESMEIEPIGMDAAGLLTESLAARYDVAINDQTRDLIAAQLKGDPALTNSLFAAAAARSESFESFRSVEKVYTDEIFGGRISRSFDTFFERIVPDVFRTNAVRLLGETLAAVDCKVPLSYWRRHFGPGSEAIRTVMSRLDIFEIVSVNSGSVYANTGNRALTDYLRGRVRLEIAGENRALVVGEASTGFLKRAPKIMARLYRKNSAFNMRALLSAFDCQDIAAAAIDYFKFKAELKGLNDRSVEGLLRNSEDKIRLPQIVYTANTVAFYPKIGELIDDERSTVALGFEASDYLDETVWIAAEIDSKLEATGELAEFWCDRLEMVALSCNFASFKLWLVAPEGFSDEAAQVLSSRGVYGSSRRQVEWLMGELTGAEIAGEASAADEYEMIIPMGEDTEIIAAHSLEEIAKRHEIDAKAINQIKTALVEACINATEHSLSPDRRIYQKFAFGDGKITITVSNRGLRLADKNAREISPDEGRRGWGLKLMKGLMDEVKIEQTDDGTRITMVKNLKS